MAVSSLSLLDKLCFCCCCFSGKQGEGSVAVRSITYKDNYEESKLHTIASQEKSC